MRIFAFMKPIGKKIRGFLPLLAVLLLVSPGGRVFGQGVPVPAALRVPAGSPLLLHVYAKGVQVYSWSASASDTGKYAWVLLEAKADLYTTADLSKKAGRHFFNAAHHPVWETVDGASVEGTKLQQADAPDAGAIPWLLLKATPAPGSGPLSPASFIQRVNTKGGKAPAGGADGAHKGQAIEVDYTAEYLFYGSK
jgi:Protein of unknown function (DUF3455)